jgi:hypothetical protein
MSRGNYNRATIMYNLLFIGWNILILYILLETDAVFKWAKLFKLNFFKYKEFEESQAIYGKYQYFLSSRYPNFIVSLLTCQECLCIWLNIVGFIIFSDYLGGIWAFGLTTLLSLIGIALFKYILKKLYE